MTSALEGGTNILNQASEILGSLGNDTYLSAGDDLVNVFVQLVDTVAFTAAAISPPSNVSSNETADSAQIAQKKTEAANAMMNLLGNVGTAVSNGMEVGATVAISGATFDLAVQKMDIGAAASVDPSEALAAASASAANSTVPVTILAKIDPALINPAKIDPTAAPTFVVPPGMDSLAGVKVITSVMISIQPEDAVRSPPPPANTTITRLASPMTSMSLMGDGKKLTVKNASEPILLVSALPAYGSSPGSAAAGDPNATAYDCRPIIQLAAECAANVSIIEEQAIAKQAECNALNEGGMLLGDAKAELDECFDQVNALATLAAEKDANCTSLPVPCSGRGECQDGETGELADGSCVCEGGWIGEICDQRPSCMYVTEDGSWSEEGCTLMSIDPATGAVCACNHLTEFGVMAEILTSPDAFFSSLMTLEVNLPEPMSFEELIQVLQDIPAGEYTIVFVFLLSLAGGFIVARRYDDSKVYVHFYPQWHENVSCHTRTSPILRSLGAQVVNVLSTNHFLSVFFVLPTMPAGRSQRLLSVYNIVLAQLAILILFYGTSQNPMAAIWAQLIDICTVILIKTVSVQAFMQAMTKKADVGAIQARIDKREQLIKLQKKWILVMRQTAPEASQTARRIAASAWRGDNVLLNNDPGAPQFYDPRRVRELDMLRSTMTDQLTFKMITYRKTSGGLCDDPLTNARKAAGRAAMDALSCALAGQAGSVAGAQRTKGTGMKKGIGGATTIWRQTTSLDDEKVVGFEAVKLPPEASEAFKGLRRAPGAGTAKGKTTGLVALTGGYDDEGAPLYVLGSSEPNRFGGITTHADTASATAQLVELYVLNPRYDPKADPEAEVKQGKAAKKKEAAIKKKRAAAAKKGLPMKGMPLPDDDAVDEEHSGEPIEKKKPKVTLHARAVGLVGKLLQMDATYDDEMVKSKIARSGMAYKMDEVPACALVRQADGSVGFFAAIPPAAVPLIKPVNGSGAGGSSATPRANGSCQQRQRQLVAQKMLAQVKELNQTRKAQLATLQAELEAAPQGTAQQERAQAAIDRLEAEHTAALERLEVRAASALSALGARAPTDDDDDDPSLAASARKGGRAARKPSRCSAAEQELLFEADEEAMLEAEALGESGALHWEGRHSAPPSPPPSPPHERNGNGTGNGGGGGGGVLALSTSSIKLHVPRAPVPSGVDGAAFAKLEEMREEKTRRAARKLVDEAKEIEARAEKDAVDFTARLKDLEASGLLADDALVQGGRAVIEQAQKRAQAIREKLQQVAGTRDRALQRLEQRASRELAAIEGAHEAQVAHLTAGAARPLQPAWLTGLLDGTRQAGGATETGGRASSSSSVAAKGKGKGAGSSNPLFDKLLDDTIDPWGDNSSEAACAQFVQALHVRRVRAPIVGATRAQKHVARTTFSVTYRYTGGKALSLSQVVLTPMVVHRRLSVQYHRRRVEGWTHDEAMAELSEHSGLPVVWRGCIPFTGNYNPTRLLVGWTINWTIFVLLLGLILFDWLSLRDIIPFGDVMTTFLLSTILLPLVGLVAPTLVKTGAYVVLIKGPLAKRWLAEKFGCATRVVIDVTAPAPEEAPAAAPAAPVPLSLLPRQARSVTLLAPVDAAAPATSGGRYAHLMGNGAASSAGGAGGGKRAARLVGSLSASTPMIYAAMREGENLSRLEREQEEQAAQLRETHSAAVAGLHMAQDAVVAMLRKQSAEAGHSAAELQERLDAAEVAHQASLDEVTARRDSALAELAARGEGAKAQCHQNAAAHRHVVEERGQLPPKESLVALEAKRQEAMKAAAGPLLAEQHAAQRACDQQVTTLTEAWRALDDGTPQGAAQQRRQKQGLGKQVEETQLRRDASLSRIEARAFSAVARIDREHKQAVEKLTVHAAKRAASSTGLPVGTLASAGAAPSLAAAAAAADAPDLGAGVGASVPSDPHAAAHRWLSPLETRSCGLMATASTSSLPGQPGRCAPARPASSAAGRAQAAREAHRMLGVSRNATAGEINAALSARLLMSTSDAEAAQARRAYATIAGNRRASSGSPRDRP